MNGRRRAIAVCTVALVGALGLTSFGCTSNTKRAASNPNPSTTAVQGSPTDPVFAKRGPYEAGVTTLQLADGRSVEVWYPAQPNATKGKQPDSYAIATWLPASVTSKIPPDQSPLYVTKAYRDVTAAPGSFPLVVFSHGVLSWRSQSTFLTDHLASWGIVVMSPDHLERGIATIFEPATKPVDDVGDLERTIDLGLAENERADGPLKERIDASKIGAVGHSAGGAAVLKLGARDARVKSVVSLTTPLRDTASWPAGKPVEFIAGTADRIIPSQSVVDGYNALTNAPKRLVLIKDAGHLAFAEICEIGKDRGGILRIAVANGITVNDQVVRLGSDGCNPPDTDPLAAWPVIQNFTTAQLYNTLGLDATPIGLGAGVEAKFPGVQVEYLQAG